MSHKHWLQKTEVEAKAERQDLIMKNPKGGRNQEGKTMHAITMENKVTRRKIVECGSENKIKKTKKRKTIKTPLPPS